MRNVFLFGLIAGIASVIGFAYAAPFLVQDRVRAETRVQTNGGRLEVFQVRTASDILSEAPGTDSDLAVTPSNTVWYPELAPFAGSGSLYRLRNESGSIIGVASRVRAMRDDADVEWVLHIPARGTIALTGVSVDSAEVGTLRVGVGEFVGLAGDWEANLGSDGIWQIRTIVRSATEEDEFVEARDAGASDVQPIDEGAAS